MTDSERSIQEAEAILQQLAGDLSPAPPESRRPAAPLPERKETSPFFPPHPPVAGPAGPQAGKTAKAHLLAEDKFRSLLEAVPDALVIIKKDGAIALVNTQAERMFGYRREELFGQPVEVLIPERFHSKHKEHRAGY